MFIKYFLKYIKSAQRLFYKKEEFLLIVLNTVFSVYGENMIKLFIHLDVIWIIQIDTVK